MAARTLILLLGCACLSVGSAYCVQITEDDRYVYYKMEWPEIADDPQRELMKHFDDQLFAKLNDLNVPSTWTQKAEDILLENQDQFNSIIVETQTRANTYAAEQNINLQKLVPVGFIVGLGVSGSGNFTIGVGGSALLTIVAVPFEVFRLDKITRDIDHYFEVSWSLGGLGQGGVGVGQGGGLVVHVGVGIIWGPLPDASNLVGVAAGATGSLTAVQGLGFKVAFVFNSDTKKHNLVAMATVDIGAAIETNVQAALFYFMSANEIVGFIGSGAFGTSQGTTNINAVDLKAFSNYIGE